MLVETALFSLRICLASGHPQFSAQPQTKVLDLELNRESKIEGLKQNMGIAMLWLTYGSKNPYSVTTLKKQMHS